ncbi:LysE family translocator [Reyranella sp.]|uniref:LysE family translocator n=1 Tax=Reyranella sp. TaxID=1929291 RepID=UPI0012278AA6|nr:LysE family translocator [Reyranella sp.]TAJ87330.1 MAG: LysE family translocator [Reyranella sp.]
MDFTNLLVFAAAYFAVVILPGPAITALVARVLARGTRGAPAFIAGCATGSLIWVTVAAAGLAAIASAFATLFLAIKYAGAAYLLYLAWKFWTTDVRPMKAADVPLEGRGRLFLAGLAINLGNPKAMAFFLALLPTMVRLDALTLLGVAELGAIVVVIVSVVFSAYTIAAARARCFFTSPRALRRMNRGSAVAVAGTAVIVATR